MPRQKINSFLWNYNCEGFNSQRISIATEYVSDSTGEVKLGLYPVSQKITLIDQTDEFVVDSLPTSFHLDSTPLGIMPILDYVLTDVKCVPTKSGVLFSVYGSSTIDPPSEFFGLLSKSDGWLWWYYGDQYEVYDENGNIDSLSNIYGADVLSDLNNMVHVLPR